MSEKFFKCAGCGMPDYGPMYRLGLCHECWMTRAYKGEFDDDHPAPTQPSRPELSSNAASGVNDPLAPQQGENEWTTYVE